MKSKTLLVARREFIERIRSRGFLIGTIATPILLLVVALTTSMTTAEAPSDTAVVEPVASVQTAWVEGVVDEADVLSDVSLPVDLRPYAMEAEADQALRAGDIVEYTVIPPDYRETGNLRRVSLDLPLTGPRTGLLESVLRFALVADQPEGIGERLVNPLGQGGIETVVLDIDEGVRREDPGMLPFVAAAAIMVPLFTGGGLLLRSLAQEKESRIMEVLLVSIKPNQLLAGKLLGMTALIVVQYLGWALIYGLASRVTGQQTGALLQGLRLEGTQLVIVALYAIGGFAVYAALMAGLGALTPDTHSSQSWVFILSVPMMVPFYFWMAIIQAPDSPVAIGLSLFPLSAPLAMIMRIFSTVVPVWQLAASLALMALTAVGIVALTARLFRAQVLLSGEPLSARRIVQALRS
jgi:ABC-2 type transport system permease protein